MLFLGMLLVASANAQQTYQELEQITVNEQVTTVVTASEPIHFVDVSTDKVAGDKPIDILFWYIYTMEYYSAIKKNTFESVLMRWMKLEPIIQSEVSQKEKHQYSILTHI